MKTIKLQIATTNNSCGDCKHYYADSECGECCGPVVCLIFKLKRIGKSSGVAMMDSYSRCQECLDAEG